MPFDIRPTEMPGFARAVELVSDAAPENIALPIDLQDGASFLVATVTLRDGRQPNRNTGQLKLRHDGYSQPPIDSPQVYVSPAGNLAIYNNPAGGTWSLEFSPAASFTPVAINLMVFYVRNRPPSTPKPPFSPTVWWKSCKIGAKALALAIVAAATLPAIPAALIAAVAAYLKVGFVVAGVFIQSVLGDTADIVAEKLCKQIGLC